MHRSLIPIAALGGVLAAGAASTAGSAPATLRPLGATVRPGFTGRLDRFDADVKGNRLFLAAQERGTLEVFELSSGKHLRSVRGFDTPHRALPVPDRQRLVVIDSGAGHSRIINGHRYHILDTIKLPPGAATMGYDPDGRMLYVMSGGHPGGMETSWLSKVNPRTGQRISTLAINTDQVAGIAVERAGPNLYLNLASRGVVAVINKSTFTLVDQWTVSGAPLAASMALDEAGHRLFVVTGQPSKVVVIDTSIGYTIGAFGVPGPTNDILFDSRSRRLYLTGPNGITVVQQSAGGRYAVLERVPTARGAGAGLLVPELGQLFVAQSASEDGDGAAVLRFDLLPATDAGAAVAVR